MSARTILLIITAATASLLEILDSSIVNVAIPSMMGNLGATLDEISWVTTGYMMANSVVLPIAAWLGNRLGRKRYFTAAILVFTLASFACGMASNLMVLIFFRIIQGTAGGALLPTSQTLIQEQFPKEKAGLAMAIFGMSVMIGPALGPTLGGYLTDQLGWRSIFNVNIPIGCLAALLSWLYVDDTVPPADRAQQKVDWTGLGLLCMGVGCLQFVLERGEAEGWFESNLIILTALFAGLGILSFIIWEISIPNPIMNLRLFKHNVLRSGTLLMVGLGIMVYALTFIVPIFVAQMIPQMSATQTGELFIPGAILTGITMLPVGLLINRISPKFLVLVGFLLGEGAVFWMTRLTPANSSETLLFPLALRGFGMAFLFVPINHMVLGSFRGPELGQVAGIQNFFRQLGGSIGIASLSTCLTRFGAQHYNDQMAKVNALNPIAYQRYLDVIHSTYNEFRSALGGGRPQTLAVKKLYYQIHQQVFLLSFEQLCWLIMGILIFALIPLYFIRPNLHSNQASLELSH